MKVCPAEGCTRPLAEAKPHCEHSDRKTLCGWVKCRCGAVIRQDGHHYRIPSTNR